MLEFADNALATRLEGLCASELKRFVETACVLDPKSAAATLEVGGGVAVYVAPGSPVNRSIGLGMRRAVKGEDVGAIETFYSDRDTLPLMSVCPLSHPSLLAALGSRGWVPDGFENVLYREVGEGDRNVGDTPPEIEIREVASQDDRDTWRLAAAIAFSAPLPPLDEQLALGEIIVRRPGTRLFTAFLDGRAAGTGELHITREIAWLSADATLPQFRRKGVHAALQRHRLAVAARAGCTLAVTEATPGGASMRNMERAGFRVAYTRVDMVLPSRS